MKNPFEQIDEKLSVIENLLFSLSERKNNNVDYNLNNDEHLTISELAKFLHCSKSSIHNIKKLGLPSFKIGRVRLFSKKEVLEFMREKPINKKGKVFYK